MAVKFRAVTPEALTPTAFCFSQDGVEDLLMQKHITLSGVVARHLQRHVCFHADHSQY